MVPTPDVSSQAAAMTLPTSSSSAAAAPLSGSRTARVSAARSKQDPALALSHARLAHVSCVSSPPTSAASSWSCKKQKAASLEWAVLLDDATASISPASPSFIAHVLMDFDQGSRMHLDRVLKAIQQALTFDPDVQATAGTATPCAISPALVLQWIRTLNTHHISRLNKKFASLIQTIFAVDWLLLPELDYLLFRDFMLNVVSAHPLHMSEALHAIIKHFKHRATYPAMRTCIPTTNSSMAGSSGLQVDRSTCIFRAAAITAKVEDERAHECLSMLIRLIPSSLHQVHRTVHYLYPSMRADLYLHESYLTNILRMSTYATPCRNALFDLILAKLIQLDLDIQVFVEDMDEEELECIQADLFQASNEPQMEDTVDPEAVHAMTLEDDIDDHDAEQEQVLADQEEDDNASSSTAPLLDQEKVTKIREKIVLLDHLLNVIFAYLTDMQASLPASAFELIFVELLNSFERIILPTMKCRYTQFIYFYLANLNGKFSDSFLGLLAAKLFSSDANEERSRPSGTSVSHAAFSSSYESVPSSTSSSSSSSSSSTATAPHASYPASLYGNLSHPSSTSSAISASASASSPISSPSVSKVSYGYDAIRLIAASYIGSYVARAKKLSPSTVKTCLELLLSWCDNYIAHDYHQASLSRMSKHFSQGSMDLEDHSIPPTFRHAVFYAVSQAIFYIFCFRHADILHDHPVDLSAASSANVALTCMPSSPKAGLSASPASTLLFPKRSQSSMLFVMKIKSSLERLLACRLNPLSMCLPSVAQEFARITSEHELLYCFGLLERGKPPMMMSATSNSTSMSHASVTKADGHPRPPSPPMDDVVEHEQRTDKALLPHALERTISSLSPSNVPATASSDAAPAPAPGTMLSFATLMTLKEIENYFPFDPFKLKLSSKYISPEIYIEWSDVNAADELDEDDEEGEDEEEDDDDEEDDDELA